MSEIPAKLQCAYCIRNSSHGGECRANKYDDTGCLIFKLDPRGCIREKTGRLYFPLFYDIPLKVWDDNWTICGVDSAIRIDYIYAIKWDKNSGQIILHCMYQYFINEYDDRTKEFKEKKKTKANLRIIK